MDKNKKIAPYASRIIGLEDVNPRDLLSNPYNWRVHPPEQRDALEAFLKSHGWGDSIKVNWHNRRIIDGHLRWEIAIRQNLETVPVLKLDLNDEEERLFLAMFSKLAEMGQTDEQRLVTLLETVGSYDEAVGTFLQDMREAAMGALVLPPQATEASYIDNPFADRFQKQSERLAAEAMGAMAPAEPEAETAPLIVGEVGTFTPAAPGAAPAQRPQPLRVIQMMMTNEVYEQTLAKITLISKRYGTQTVTDTILKMIEVFEVPATDGDTEANPE